MANNSRGLEEDEVNDWWEMKKYDDDHDNEWFILEEKKMADLYGGDFIRVKYTSQGRVGYFCELCCAECNAKKCLHTHCSGMKHLKRKDIWEKAKKGIPTEEEESEFPTDPMRSRLGRNQATTKYGHGNQFSPTSTMDRIPVHDRIGFSKTDREFSSSYHRGENHSGTSKRHTSEFAQENTGRYEKIRKPEPPWILKNEEREEYGNVGMPRYLSMNSEKTLLHSPDRYQNSMEPSSPRDRRWTPATKRPSSQSDDVHSKKDQRSRSPIPRNSTPENLKDSPAGMLIQKLAECSVKTPEDSTLALTVLISLTKSLKEYYVKKNEEKVFDLLMETEQSFNTVKILLESNQQENITDSVKPMPFMSLNTAGNFQSSAPAQDTDIRQVYGHPFPGYMPAIISTPNASNFQSYEPNQDTRPSYAFPSPNYLPVNISTPTTSEFNPTTYNRQQRSNHNAATDRNPHNNNFN